jgi:hypothetical protein
MYKRFLMALALCLCILVAAPAAQAGYGDSDPSSTRKEKGFFIGLGAVAGYELNELTAFGGGLTGPFGYKINSRMAVYAQTDIYFTRDQGLNFLITNFVPTFRYDVYKSFYAYYGFGYALMSASAGASFSGVNVTVNSLFNGFTMEGGAGYEHYFNDRFSVTPTLGYNYTYVASSHLLVPNLRVNFNYYF